MGWGSVSEISEIVKGMANITLAIDESLRGRGDGKTIMETLLRLSSELAVESLGAGTMKANKATACSCCELGG